MIIVLGNLEFDTDKMAIERFAGSYRNADYYDPIPTKGKDDFFVKLLKAKEESVRTAVKSEIKKVLGIS